MLRTILLCSGLLAAGPPTDGDLQTYQVARAQAGRDADAHVRLALWCEAHGLKAERLKHLALAVAIDPAQAAARGLMGLVADGGQWRRPEAVAEAIRADAELAAKRAAYNGRRARAKDTSESQWNLALWCEAQGLKAEAMVHFTAVTRLPPPRPWRRVGIVGPDPPASSADHREAAWKRLGCRRYRGRWMTEEQIAAEKAEAVAQHQADRHWQPLLEKWAGWLADPARRAQAQEALVGVTDPRAVPTVWEALGEGGPDRQVVAAQVLGQIDAAGASRGLAVLAISGRSAEVRRVAAETLRWRDPRDVVALLADRLRPPLRYEVRPVGGPGSPGELFVEGERYNVHRTYAAPAIRPDRLPPRLFGDDVPFDPSGGQVPGGPTGLSSSRPGNPAVPLDVLRAALRDVQIGQVLQEARVATSVFRRRLSDDIAAVEASNAAIRQSNDLVLSALSLVTGQDLGADRESWRRWWTDAQGYAYQSPPPRPKPTFSQAVDLPFTPSYTQPPRTSCFGAGTPVLTREGLRPIEALRTGDQVLTQDTTTGALSYQPVMAIYHNPPTATLRVTLGAETIVATGIHRFWRAGRGWAMARDLTPGDAIRTLGGLETVTAVESDAVQPVFNLEVARGRSFLVGQAGALVHDNSLVEPTPDPFDAAPALAVAPGDRVE